MRDPIFKGCTRPPMLFGVPFVPLVVVAGVFLLLALWGGIFSGLGALVLTASLLLPLLTAMRTVTAIDDQRLLQWVIRIRIGQMRSRWTRALLTYAPTLRNFKL